MFGATLLAEVFTMHAFRHALLHVLALAYKDFDRATPGTSIVPGYGVITISELVWQALLGGHTLLRVTAAGVSLPESQKYQVPNFVPAGSLDQIGFVCDFFDRAPLARGFFEEEPTIYSDAVDFVVRLPPEVEAKYLLAFARAVEEMLDHRRAALNTSYLPPHEVYPLLRKLIIRWFSETPLGDVELF